MKNYFLSLIVTAVIGAVLSSAAGSTFEKYLKYIISLVCVIILLLPLKELLAADFSFGYEYEGTSEVEYDNSLIEKISEENIKKAIEKTIFENFSIKPEEISIDINSTADGLSVEKIEIILNQANSKLRESIKQKLKELLGIDVEVNVSGIE